MNEDLIGLTVRREQDAPWVEAVTMTGWPKIYGVVVEETETKARIRWDDGLLFWESKCDLVVLGR